MRLLFVKNPELQVQVPGPEMPSLQVPFPQFGQGEQPLPKYLEAHLVQLSLPSCFHPGLQTHWPVPFSPALQLPAPQFEHTAQEDPKWLGWQVLQSCPMNPALHEQVPFPVIPASQLPWTH